MEFDFTSAVMAGVTTLSLSAVVTALINYGEGKEFKKNIGEKVDANYKDLKDEIIAHEERDDDRHKEIIGRIASAENNILEVFKRGN